MRFKGGDQQTCKPDHFSGILQFNGIGCKTMLMKMRHEAGDPVFGLLPGSNAWQILTDQGILVDGRHWIKVAVFPGSQAEPFCFEYYHGSVRY